jgi:two-component system, OmpR family, response regulator
MDLQRLDDLKIVVVDDQEDVRSAVGRFLSDMGAQVQVCKNVDEVLDVVPKLQLDLIISDIRMPGKDGFELLNAIRCLERDFGREVPIIAMSAHELEIEDEEKLGNSPGFNGFLQKPFTPDVLMQAISDVLRVAIASPKRVVAF